MATNLALIPTTETAELVHSLSSIFKGQCLVAAPNTLYDSKFFGKVVKDIKEQHPEHYALAVELADTATFTTNRNGRTTHYIGFDFDKVTFTDNLSVKMDNYFKGGFCSDPWIGKKPSKAEIIQVASWLIACISNEDGTQKTY